MANNRLELETCSRRNPSMIEIKALEFIKYNASVEKLMDEIQWKESNHSNLKKTKKSSKQITLTSSVKAREEEKEEQVIDSFGPPKLFTGKHIQQINFILSFPSLQESISNFSICSKSMYELYKIVESREIYIKIPFTILIVNGNKIIVMKNHIKGWIELITCEEYSIVKEEIFSWEDVKVEPGGKNKEEPKYIVKIFNQSMNSNETTFFSNHNKLCMDISKWKSSVPLIVIQKFVGFMSFGSISEKTPYIFRCIFTQSKPIQIYSIKRIKNSSMDKVDRNLKGNTDRKKSKRNSSFECSAFPATLIEFNDKMNKKYCVNEKNKNYIKVNQFCEEDFPELTDLSKTIKNLFQKYSLTPLRFSITKLVMDFIQTSVDSFCFLQIKYIEAAPNIVDIEKKIMLMRAKKGLNPSRPKCECFFCNPFYENEIHYFVEALKQRRLIFSNHNEYGINIDKQKNIQDYIDEYCSINGKLFSNTNVPILEPLISLSLPKPRSSIKKSKIIIHENEIETKNTCDVCHKIIELYINKKNKLYEKNSQVILKLKMFKKISFNNFTIETFCELIDELGFSLPTIEKINHLINSPLNSSNPYLHQKKYFFGYQVVSDSIKPIKVFSPKAKKSERKNSKNFINFNKRNLLLVNEKSTIKDIDIKEIKDAKSSTPLKIKKSMISRNYSQIYDH